MFGKQRSNIGSISRAYAYENIHNGGLGPNYFINKFIFKRNIVSKQPIFDLSIYILSETLNTNLVTEIKNSNKKYNFNIQNYLTNLGNINSIKKNINNDKNNKLLIIDTNQISNFTDLKIPFINNNNNNKIIERIQTIMFYKIEEKIKNRY